MISYPAFEVDNIDCAFEHIKGLDIQTTSNHVTTDLISGLKQFFIQSCHAGFFIELIERPSSSTTTTTTTNTTTTINEEEDEKEGDNEVTYIDKDVSLRRFSNNNMAELAQSIRHLVVDDDNDDDDGANRNNTKEEEYPSALDGGVSGAGVQIDVGDIIGAEICVEDVTTSANFLTCIFNFRIISVSDTGQRIHLRLIGSSTTTSNYGMNIFLVQAISKAEERQATIIFNTVSSTLT